MSDLGVWANFLRGRIAQERGDNDQALEAFDSAVNADPENHFFLTARANALQAAGRGEEIDDMAALASVHRGYASLAHRLVGDADQPEAWIKGLEGLLSTAEAGRIGTATMVVW